MERNYSIRITVVGEEVQEGISMQNLSDKGFDAYCATKYEQG